MSQTFKLMFYLPMLGVVERNATSKGNVVRSMLNLRLFFSSKNRNILSEKRSVHAPLSRFIFEKNKIHVERESYKSQSDRKRRNDGNQNVNKQNE